MKKLYSHSISDIESNFGGSMFMPEGSVGIHVLDARTGTDTYMEQAVRVVERNNTCGSATVPIADLGLANVMQHIV